MVSSSLITLNLLSMSKMPPQGVGALFNLFELFVCHSGAKIKEVLVVYEKI